MANVNNPFGFKLVGRLGGGIPSGRVYYTADAGTNGLFIGDPVKSAGSSNSAGYQTVVQAAAGDTKTLGAIIGIVKGPLTTHALAPKIPAKTFLVDDDVGYLSVCDDPYALYEIQEDSVGGDIADTSIGEFCDFIVAAGNTTTGISQVMVDSSDATTGDNLVLLERKHSPDNENAAYCKFIVMFNEHAYKAVGLPT